MKGKEIHEWLESCRVKVGDYLFGLNNGMPAISYVETALWEKDRLTILKLKDSENAYEGYPMHYKEADFPITDLRIIRAHEMGKNLTDSVRLGLTEFVVKFTDIAKFPGVEMLREIPEPGYLTITRQGAEIERLKAHICTLHGKLEAMKRIVASVQGIVDTRSVSTYPDNNPFSRY